MVKIPPIYGDLGDGLLLFYPHYLGNRLKEHVLFWGVLKQIQARIMGWANLFFTDHKNGASEKQRVLMVFVM